MTGALKKNTLTSYTPGSPGVPGTPGTPYIPAVPAYTTTKLVRNTYVGDPVTTFHWTDRYGQPRVSQRLSDVPTSALDITTVIKSPLDFFREMIGFDISAAAAHYGEVRGLVTIWPSLPRQQMILRWTHPWAEILTSVTVPAVPAVPAVPPTPGVPGTPTTMSRDFNIGWNAGARSVVSATGDCELTFTASPSAVGIVVGLNDADHDTSYFEIDFGLYLTKGVARVQEGGSSAGVYVTFTAGDVFRVQRRGSTITYAKGGVIFHTSNSASYGEVFADTSMFMGGDEILSATFTALSPAASSAGRLAPLTGGGSDKSYTSSTAVLQPLRGLAYNAPKIQSTGMLAPLAGGGSDMAYTQAAGVLHPLMGTAQAGGHAPDYTISAGVLCYFIGSSTVLTGEVASASGTLAPLETLSSDYPYTTASGALAPLEGYSVPEISWAGWSASADLVMPGPFLLEARATRHPLNTLEARMPRFSLEAWGGAQLRATMPMPTLQATGTGAVIGRINATMPMPTLEASGITGSVGRIDATLRGGFTLEAYGGAVIEAILQDGFTLQASGTTGAVGRLTATMPMFELEAHASADQVGRIDATMPMIRPVASAVLDVLMPMFRLVASGHAVVAVEYEAYTMNLVGPVDLDPRSPHAPSGREITRYTHFPFDQIVRHGDKYYGVSSTGLYLLGGDTDDGAPIPWAFRTATTDFGTIQRKTVVSAYVGGKVMPTATARIIAGEQGEITYSYPVPPSATNQNYRVRFGRGLKTRYFALEMADARGGDVRADSIDFEINTMTRAL